AWNKQCFALPVPAMARLSHEIHPKASAASREFLLKPATALLVPSSGTLPRTLVAKQGHPAPLRIDGCASAGSRSSINEQASFQAN
ncbi:MAG: hypothetical protein ABIK89_05505, partial [Planctomycetota bacterium]